MLQLTTVQEQLAKLLFHFPGNGRTVDGLIVIAPDYLVSFKGLYESEFVEIVDNAIQTRKFFPTIADLKQVESETGLRDSYNPYGGTGSLMYVEDMPVIQELDEADRVFREKMLKDLTKNIGKEMPN